MDPTFVYGPEGDVMVTVHGPLPPTDEEWRAYLEFSRTCVGRVTRSLVVSSGAGPNGRQRTMLMKEFPEFAPVPVAVVSDSSMTGGNVTALSCVPRFPDVGVSRFPHVGVSRFPHVPHVLSPSGAHRSPLHRGLSCSVTQARRGGGRQRASTQAKARCAAS